MAKRKDPLLEALADGRSYTWTIPEGGNLASMRAAVKHGQTLTMAPVIDPQEVQVGDMVLVLWHNSTIFHLVGEIQDGRFLIVNSVGKINGWVDRDAILGRVTEVVDPKPRPGLPVMLEQLEAHYRELLEHEQPAEDDARRLLSIVDDLRWYAGRIGVDHWDEMPRSNIWSFQQNLWRLTRQAKASIGSSSPPPVHTLIDRGKKCVGQAAEILTLFASSGSDQKV
jgi:hypothetical protein